MSLEQIPKNLSEKESVKTKLSKENLQKFNQLNIPTRE